MEKSLTRGDAKFFRLYFYLFLYCRYSS